MLYIKQANLESNEKLIFKNVHFQQSQLTVAANLKQKPQQQETTKAQETTRTIPENWAGKETLVGHIRPVFH